MYNHRAHDGKDIVAVPVCSSGGKSFAFVLLWDSSIFNHHTTEALLTNNCMLLSPTPRPAAIQRFSLNPSLLPKATDQLPPFSPQAVSLPHNLLVDDAGSARRVFCKLGTALLVAGLRNYISTIVRPNSITASSQNIHPHNIMSPTPLCRLYNFTTL